MWNYIAEEELLSMLSNDLYGEAYKETLEDFGFEGPIVDKLTKDLISRMDTELYRKINKMEDSDIHMVPPKNINNV
jgi:hypothetical protein